MIFTRTVTTPVKLADAILTLWGIWRKQFGKRPSLETLALIMAQMCFETGWFKVVRNYNLGNIKVGAAWDGKYCQYHCSEYVNGKLVKYNPPHRETWFRAYPTLEAGMYGYLHLLLTNKRYTKAWKQLLAGNPKAYCQALSDAGYYTDNVDHYTKQVVAIYGVTLERCAKLICDGDPYRDSELYD